MQSWHTTYLGLRELPPKISTFELQSFFTYSRTERELINARRGNAHKLGLALHIGFLRLSGRLLNSVRIVPAMLWQHLGNEIGIATPELASLRALYVRGRTLFGPSVLSNTMEKRVTFQTNHCPLNFLQLRWAVLFQSMC